MAAYCFFFFFFGGIIIDLRLLDVRFLVSDIRLQELDIGEKSR